MKYYTWEIHILLEYFKKFNSCFEIPTHNIYIIYIYVCTFPTLLSFLPKMIVKLERNFLFIVHIPIYFILFYCQDFEHWTVLVRTALVKAKAINISQLIRQYSISPTNLSEIFKFVNIQYLIIIIIICNVSGL